MLPALDMPPKMLFPPAVPVSAELSTEEKRSAPVRKAPAPRVAQKPRGKAVVGAAITNDDPPPTVFVREKLDWDDDLDDLRVEPEFERLPSEAIQRAKRVAASPEPEVAPTRSIRSRASGATRVGSAFAAPALAKAEPERPQAPTRTPEQARTAYQRWLVTLPSPSESLRGASGLLPEPERWIPEFRRYLFAFLAPVYSDLDTRRDALGDNFVRVFMRAFTDVSFSADDNETIELLGDKVLGLVFTQHVHSRVPSAGPSELTQYNSNYMSKGPQAELAAALKMDQWVLLGASSAARRDSAVTISMKEDVFESFFASLYSVATQLHQDRLRARQYEEASLKAVHGAEAARILIDFMFDGIGLDPEKGKNAARSILIDIAKMYGLRMRGIRFDPPSDGPVGAKHSVYMSRELQSVLADVGFKGIPLVLARDYPDKTAAALAALAVLADHGLDEQAIEDQREITSGVMRLQPESLRDAVLAKARAMGYPKLLFETPQRSKQPDGTMLIVLIGVNDRDERFTLSSVTTSDFRRGKADAAQLFLAAM